MNLNPLLFPVLTAFAASLFFVALFYVLFLRNRKKLMQKQYEEKLSAFQLQANIELEKQLELYTKDLQKKNAAEVALLKEELKAWSAYEVELLKSKLKNTQPSYPKKLEAAQKLAVLLNGITSSSVPLFTEWRAQLQQYLINYTGMISAESEALIASAIDSCGAQDLQLLLSILIKAKACLKEGALVSTKVV
jgi:hypothetical protein